MMRNIIIAVLLTMPAMLFAQSWETVPTKEKAQLEQTTTRKLTKNEKKAQKLEADRPYLAGAVPEVDGKVEYNVDVELPGKSDQQIYDLAMTALDNLAHDANQKATSKVALINRDEKKIVAKYDEWMVFANKILELDRTEFSYVIEAECVDGCMHLKIFRLRYEYGSGKYSLNASADDVITDRLMLTKDGTQLKKTNAKFRRKTVDRVNDIINTIKGALL